VIETGEIVEAQMPNPGRLSELLLPGARLYVSHIDPWRSCGSAMEAAREDRWVRKRKTNYTVWAVERDKEVIFLHTHQTNRVAHYLLRRSRIPSLAAARVHGTEVVEGRSRFDFLMEEKGKTFFLEVKSVTLFGNGAALFPDAVTSRGKHHLEKLAELGLRAEEYGLPKPVMLFLIHSDRVDRFLPDYHTDFAFAKTFLSVRNQVRLLPVSIGWTQGLELKDTVRELPIPWTFLDREVRDGGAYVLLLRVDNRKQIIVGKLGVVDFQPGWYVYVGSAAKGLSARIARHLRRRKRFHWHIDFLRDQTSRVVGLPIRSTQKQECALADELSQVFKSHSPGFGSSDCSCRTHLYFSSQDPFQVRGFHEVLERFRMPLSSL